MIKLVKKQFRLVIVCQKFYEESREMIRIFFHKSHSTLQNNLFTQYTQFYNELRRCLQKYFPNMENLCYQSKILKSFLLIGFMSHIKVLWFDVILGSV